MWVEAEAGLATSAGRAGSVLAAIWQVRSVDGAMGWGRRRGRRERSQCSSPRVVGGELGKEAAGACSSLLQRFAGISFVSVAVRAEVAGVGVACDAVSAWLLWSLLLLLSLPLLTGIQGLAGLG